MRTEQQRHGGGLAAWAIAHPVGVTMIAAAVVVLGLMALGRLSVDLLPQLTYPEIRVRIIDPGVPASIMEDRVTRQLEEQLAITEDAIAVQSRSNQGASSVDLSFAYGTDIDAALRDASTRLDRAKRFLPETIQPPVIYKRDPSQIAVAEFVVAARDGDLVALRDWVDYDFAKQFINLPGVAAVEVGGGLLREIRVLPDERRLTALGLSLDELADQLEKANIEESAGRLTMQMREMSGRTDARVTSVEELRELPVHLPDGGYIPLSDVAEVQDRHSEQRIEVRLNGTVGVKVSIQKQPSANTIEVVEAVNARLAWLQEEGLLVDGVAIMPVSDQAFYVRNAVSNASLAAISGTLLAMAVVYLFLGSLRRTLIIGSAIPLAVLVTFTLMEIGGLTFNIMTLGGLALGVGMLVDNTIVMLENIQRHQREGEAPAEAGSNAAAEINSAIVAATSTNLAAVLPFLFVGGLVGLLFRELIFTISAAILASMVVALTLVPAWGVKVRSLKTGRLRGIVDGGITRLQQLYVALIGRLLRGPLLQGAVVAGLMAGLVVSVPYFGGGTREFLPAMDDGSLIISVSADPGTSLREMDRAVRRIEALLQQQSEVESVFSLVGGFIFGRTERESSNRSTVTVQLVPSTQRHESLQQWIRRFSGQVRELQLAGITVRMRARGVRGIRLGSGDDDLSLRIRGSDQAQLRQLADHLLGELQAVQGIRNLQHSAEEVTQELLIEVDRLRAAEFGVTPGRLARIVRMALEGEVVTTLLEGDRAYAIRLRLPAYALRSPAELAEVVVRSSDQGDVRLGDVATIGLNAAPAEIRRDNQQRIVEVSASLDGALSSAEVYRQVDGVLAELVLPVGYAVYKAGSAETLQESNALGAVLLPLALFLVLVVMAVQYESLRNPLVILLSVPFTVIGVALGLLASGLVISMPVWLGMIMLAGIVVNNAIILVEYMELARDRGMALDDAVVEAARLRLRPILMTTLTTVMGMLPLALGLGEGAEMLHPLAVTLISGLLFSLLVTLLLIPIMYRWINRAERPVGV